LVPESAEFCVQKALINSPQASAILKFVSRGLYPRTYVRRKGKEGMKGIDGREGGRDGMGYSIMSSRDGAGGVTERKGMRREQGKEGKRRRGRGGERTT
jgi:hypothetical protein